MSVTQSIPPDDLRGVESTGPASEWLRTAPGSVRLESDESADDARMAYYREKYGLSA